MLNLSPAAAQNSLRRPTVRRVSHVHVHGALTLLFLMQLLRSIDAGRFPPEPWHVAESVDPDREMPLHVSANSLWASTRARRFARVKKALENFILVMADGGAECSKGWILYCRYRVNDGMSVCRLSSLGTVFEGSHDKV